MDHSMHPIDRSFIILATDRLVLKRLQESDIPSLTDLWTDPTTTRWLGGPRDRAWLINELEQSARTPFAEQFDLWPVVEIDTGLVVGHCGLLEKNVEEKAEIELNYVFASFAWGKGYATEMGRALKRHAFESMGLGRLIALIEPGNIASERVAVKVGMHFEKDVIRPGGAVRRLFLAEAGFREAD
jgi:[ribosomal protein S5]-alanine N-acetyltransferase